MKQYNMECFRNFKCIADRCRHSCCIGWEIDIDSDTFEKYRNRADSLGERIRNNIDTDGVPHFRLGANDRCPFLNKNNLCEIIIEAGEDNICEICTKHPRFYNYYPDHIEMGFGLCCEEAVRLLLESDDYYSLYSDDVSDEEETADEEYIMLFHERNSLFIELIAFDIPLPERINISRDYDYEGFIELLKKQEIIDRKWLYYLENIDKGTAISGEYDQIFERILFYLIYRYYLNYGLERWQESFALDFGILSVRLLNDIFNLEKKSCETLCTDRIIDIIRMWSSELEYSEDCMTAIADFLNQANDNDI